MRNGEIAIEETATVAGPAPPATVSSGTRAATPALRSTRTRPRAAIETGSGKTAMVVPVVPVVVPALVVVVVVGNDVIGASLGTAKEGGGARGGETKGGETRKSDVPAMLRTKSARGVADAIGSENTTGSGSGGGARRRRPRRESRRRISRTSRPS